MPDLIAQGAEKEERWRRPLVEQESFILGRTAQFWAVPWDERISRHHISATLMQGELQVQQLPEARNAVFFRGRKQTTFIVKPGEHFVIGGTTFYVVNDKVNFTQNIPQPAQQQTFEPHVLRKHAFHSSDHRLAALSRLPDIIASSGHEAELWTRLLAVLMSGIAWAKSVALVKHSQNQVTVLQWDQRDLAGGDFEFSEKLIQQAVQSHASIVHVWQQRSLQQEFTQQLGVDWAFCTPLYSSTDTQLAIYASGAFPTDVAVASPDLLRDDLKFAELVATTFRRLREAQQTERRLAGLSQFLSPVVLRAITQADAETVLAPREADVTVLFCDLRGFTRRSEQSAGHLFDLLERVSQALGVMTRHILEHGGVIGDFHGDAAMGFWGWPLSQHDTVERAAQAALAIRAEFLAAQSKPHDVLADFQIGIGIASGRAVAGKIGSRDQVKVTAFGPVVNLASRLESLTKILQTPILLDEPTAHVLRQTSPPLGQLRRVVKLIPSGMTQPVLVTELLPLENNGLTSADIHAYEIALDAFIAGKWELAWQTLHQVSPNDKVKDFLAIYMARQQRRPPHNWSGAIALQEK